MTGWRRSPRSLSQRSWQQPHLPGIFAHGQSHRLASPREQALKCAHHRIIFIIFLFCLAFSTITIRLGYLTLFNDTPDPQATASTDNKKTIISRADITDRHGTVLATSLPTMSLCADSRKISNPDEAVKLLLTILPDIDTRKLHDDMRSAKHCTIIKRHLTPKQQYDINGLGIAGLEFQHDEKRVYPSGNVAAHVLGFTDIDSNGIAGTERYLNNTLSQSTDAIALSIDLRVQNIVRHELMNTMKEFKAIGGTGIVLDITNGETLALVSLPDFDPQHPQSSNDDERFNRSTLGVYEMGSTFKIFNTAMALDSGLININERFDTVQPLVIGRHKIRDFDPEKHKMNVVEIFAHSSNIGSALMADRIGGIKQRAFLRSLGLTEKLSYELPEIGSPLVPAARNWNNITTMTVSYGHGIAVNAVQLVGAVATILNNGIPVQPTLLKRTTPLPLTDQRIITPETSAMIRALLRVVVTHGTAKGAKTEGYLLGGKTGTADKVGGKNDYKGHGRVSSFIGAFPINAPRYLVFALIDDPKGNAKTSGFATGGIVSAPIARRVVSQIAPVLGMMPMSPETEAFAEKQVLKPLSSSILDGMPIKGEINNAADSTDRFD